MKIDAMMLTYNSNKPFFKTALRGLKSGVLIDNSIIIDKFSVDNFPMLLLTRKFVRKYLYEDIR